MGVVPKLLLCLFAVSLTACTHLPRGAALQREIVTVGTQETPDIAVYPITRAFLPQLATWPAHPRTSQTWLNASPGSDAQIIRPGDMLNLTIWDSGENSLLTGTDQRAAALTGLRVSGAGTIFVPYVGKLKVSGRTPDAARVLVQRQLEQSAPSVQVQLLMAEGRRNTIDLVSGVNAPGSITMPSQNFSVLSALSAAGGVDSALTNPQLKLMRGTRVYTTALQRLYDNPKLDTRLHGGDKIIVQADARYFLSLGAAGQEAQFAFPRDIVTALDALALIGGVAEARADPKGILILREYPTASVGPNGPENTRVVFTLDMTASDGLFSARHFHIQPGDLVLATESPLANTQSVLGIIGSSLGLARLAN